MKRSSIIKYISWLFSLLFVYTSINKVIDYSVFKEELSLSELLRPFSTFLAYVIPAIELSTAVILLLPKWRKRGLYSSFVLMVLFTLYIGANLLFNKHFFCGCGGAIELLSQPQHLLLNLTLTTLALTGIVLDNSTSNKKPAKMYDHHA